MSHNNIYSLCFTEAAQEQPIAKNPYGLAKANYFGFPYAWNFENFENTIEAIKAHKQAAKKAANFKYNGPHKAAKKAYAKANKAKKAEANLAYKSAYKNQAAIKAYTKAYNAANKTKKAALNKAAYQAKKAQQAALAATAAAAALAQYEYL